MLCCQVEHYAQGSKHLVCCQASCVAELAGCNMTCITSSLRVSLCIERFSRSLGVHFTSAEHHRHGRSTVHSISKDNFVANHPENVGGGSGGGGGGGSGEGTAFNSGMPLGTSRGKCSVKVGSDHQGRSIALGEPLLRVFRELMQVTNTIVGRMQCGKMTYN